MKGLKIVIFGLTALTILVIWAALEIPPLTKHQWDADDKDAEI